MQPALSAILCLQVTCSMLAIRTQIVLDFAKYHSWPQPSTQAWRYVADRTGVISTTNFVLIWAFGVRNNVLLWLTGWDFATYNNFHRWVARVATVQAVVHSVAYTVLIFQGLPNTSNCLINADKCLRWIVVHWVAILCGIFPTLVVCCWRFGMVLQLLSLPQADD